MYRQPFKGDYVITQGYGETITSSFHTGIDYGTPYGTEILASNDGIVVSCGWLQGGWGYAVIIQHNDGNATLYAHLSEVKTYLKAKVSMGDVIGLSGSTGNSTGPHLHFEARKQWNNYTSHFNPMLLPLMSVDDTLPSYTEQTDGKDETDLLPEGKCEIACECAWVRDWERIERSYRVYKGEQVYIFGDVKYKDGLPFHFIGANRCIAQYDGYGTDILVRAE